MPPILAAHGGPGWSPRTASLRQELGTVWNQSGVETEWTPLTDVLVHRPGPELDGVSDPDAVQMLAPLDADRARAQHDALAQAYREAGVRIHAVEPKQSPPPNLMFVADLLFMTPEGAVVGRPASTVRAGEERWVARRLADLGIPILRCVRGQGAFEGADALWLNPETVLLATGWRTNEQGAGQVTSLLVEMGVEVVRVGLPCSAMHLMGTLRFADRDVALAWRSRLPHAALVALRAHGYTVHFVPDEDEAIDGMALNIVTLGPRQILMPAGNPKTQAFYESLGITCHTVQVDELLKAAGGVGCLTGVLARQPGGGRVIS